MYPISTALSFLMLRCRVIFQRLLLESLERLIAVLLARGTRVDHRMYQPQFVRALRTWRVRVMDQVFCFQQLHLQIVIMVMKKDAVSLNQVRYPSRSIEERIYIYDYVSCGITP